MRQQTTYDRIISLRQQLAEVTRERDHWKANHDHQVDVKRQLMDRPDLADRARSVVELNARIAELESTYTPTENWATERAARIAAQAESERMRKALEKIAAEHEDQAQAWGGEEGDPDQSKYHAKWGRFARAALEQTRGEAR